MTDTPSQSPCVKLCAIDAGSGLCRGCLRSLDEIAAWGRLDPQAQRAILADLPHRTARLSASSQDAPPLSRR
jgi:uncharacterized protein